MKGADQPVSGTTFVTADDLEWDLEYYRPDYFEIEAFFASSSAVSGVKFRIFNTEAIPVTNFWASVDGGLTQVLTGINDFIAGAVAVGDHHVRIAGGYFPGDPPGHLSLQFAQNANLGGAVTMKRCSWWNRLPELP